MMKFINMIQLILVFALTSSCNQLLKSEKSEKPNVILINVDDLGYGDVGCYGATKVKTPNIDKLAIEGIKFTDAHSVSSVCTPSRYALLTGQYPFRKDLWHPVFYKSPLLIDTTQTTIAGVMKKAGYATACIGKWHLGFGSEKPVDWNQPLKPGPLEIGFDYYFGVPVVNSHPPFVYVENHKVVGWVPEDPLVYGEKAETQWFPEKMGMDLMGGAKAAHAKYNDREVGTKLKEQAVDWIKKHKKKPFFLYYATTNIHHPFTPAERFVGTSEAGRYGDFIHELDWIIGELMTVLKDEGLDKNTLVIFTSDNGGMLNQGGQDAWRAGHKLNGELLGFKFGAWEGGHRIPLIARWPGNIASGIESDKLIGNVDMLATLATLVNQPIDSSKIDSKNMLPVLLGDNDAKGRHQIVLCPSRKKNIAIRKDKWVYISAQNEGGFNGKNIGDHNLGGAAAHLLTGQVNSDIENGKIKEDAPPAQLYNLDTDPYQKTNVYLKYPEVVSELEQLLENELNK